jgi:hypothetical protein
MRVGEESLWDFDEHEPIKTYSNGARHMNVTDPDVPRSAETGTSSDTR